MRGDFPRAAVKLLTHSQPHRGEGPARSPQHGAFRKPGGCGPSGDFPRAITPLGLSRGLPSPAGSLDRAKHSALFPQTPLSRDCPPPRVPPDPPALPSSGARARGCLTPGPLTLGLGWVL